MKRLFSFLLALASVASISAGYRYLIDGIEYELEYPAHAYVTWKNNFNYGASYTEDTIIIPEAVIYGESANVVERILADAFRNSENLKYVSIPETVTQIGERAFENASALPSITLPSGLTVLSTHTFNFCSSLKSVTLPQNLTTIGEGAFMRCTVLDSITLPASLLSIASWAFYACDSLSSIVIPDKTLSIGGHAFYECGNLKSVTIGQKLKTLPERSFAACDLRAINIPDNITSLGEGVFENNGKLRSVRFSSALTEIPENAFYYCRSLDSVYLPSGVTSIGKWAFAYCDSLHVISIPQSLTSIHAEAFNYTKSIYDVTINAPQLFNQEGGISSIFGKQVKRYVLGDAFTSIGDSAFIGCDGLQEIVLGPNVTTIGKNAFANLAELRTVVLSDGVESIGEGAFANCPKLENITIGKNLTNISAGAFTGCTNLKTIVINSPAVFNQNFKNQYSIKDIFGDQVTNYVIGDSITGINAYTFQNCTNLTDVTIGKNVESIDHHAFYGCSALTSITIPEQVKTMNYLVFQDAALTSVHWNAIDCAFSSGYYSLFHGLPAPLDTIYLGPNVEAIPSKMYDGMTMSAYALPAHIKRIGAYAFQNCNNLRAIHISDLKAWCELEGTRELLLMPSTNTPARDLYLNGQLIQGDFVAPANITKINSFAFYNYPYITSVTIPDNVVASIGEYAFACPNITYVTVGSGVTDMYGAFRGCPLLTTVTTNTSAHTDDDSNVHMVDIFGSQVIEYTLGENVNQIGRRMFHGATSLRSVTMSEGVTKIGDEAFEGCTGLQNMTIADHVTMIGEDAFSGCSGLTEMIIGDGVETIGTRAFKDCSNLRKITFGKNIKEMSNVLLYGCTKLDTVVWNVIHFPDFNDGTATIFYYKPSATLYVDLREKIVSFTLGESVEYIPAFLCYKMKKLNTIAFPQSVDSIGRSAFSECSGLTQLQIGKGVKYLGEYAFAGCSNITEADIPSSVKFIEGGAFDDCSQLRAIYEHATTPPTMDRWAFNSTPKYKVLYVPAASVNTYKNANPWYNFDYIEPMPPDHEGIEEVIANGKLADKQKVLIDGQLYILRGEKIYTMQGQEVK